jgi:N-terminal domain of (some) glycogen debranching enzymes
MRSKTGMQIVPSEASPEAPFYIAATQAVGRPGRALKDGDTFAVLDGHGDITATPSGHDGLFYQDMRYLSHLELRRAPIYPKSSGLPEIHSLGVLANSPRL